LLMATPRTTDAAIVGRAIDDIVTLCQRGDIDAAFTVLRRQVPEYGLSSPAARAAE
jgi:hypothetical protein